MKTKYEMRILEIDEKSLITKLENLGAEKVGEFYQRRYVYDMKPAIKGKWIRLRTNGINSTLTIKSITSPLIDGTKELEIEVSDFDKCQHILNELGYRERNYLENERISYKIDDTEIDIDSWPMISTYVEIEGNNEEEVYKTLEKLSISREKLTTANVDDIYTSYGYNLASISNLKFEEE